MPRPFQPDEVAEVVARYPRLALRTVDRVSGILDLHAEFEGVVVQDEFEIEICAHNPHSDHLPALYETGGRTQAVGARHGIKDLRDLHLNPDGTACVCPKQAEREKCPPGYTLLQYVEGLVVPYLYGLRRASDNRGIWPWPDLEHGALGLLEYYGRGGGVGGERELREVLGHFQLDRLWSDYRKQLHSPSAKRRCLCGSGRHFGQCHRDAFKGVERMRKLALEAKVPLEEP